MRNAIAAIEQPAFAIREHGVFFARVAQDGRHQPVGPELRRIGKGAVEEHCLELVVAVAGNHGELNLRRGRLGQLVHSERVTAEKLAARIQILAQAGELLTSYGIQQMCALLRHSQTFGEGSRCVVQQLFGQLQQVEQLGRTGHQCLVGRELAGNIVHETVFRILVGVEHGAEAQDGVGLAVLADEGRTVHSHNKLVAHDLPFTPGKLGKTCRYGHFSHPR